MGTETWLKTAIPDLWAELLMNTTVIRIWCKHFPLDFSTLHKNIGLSVNGAKNFLSWLIWVIINRRTPQGFSGSRMYWNSCDPWLDWRHFMDSTQRVLWWATKFKPHWPSGTIRNCKTDWKNYLDFPFKLWIRMKIHAVSSGLLYLH